jgi:hypothetical protein
MVKGYKVFNPDWTCREFQYEVGKTFVEDVTPSICERGFHFCKRAVDCFNYYYFDPDNKVAEVIALGEIVEKGDKLCTNKIQIVREIPWTEVLEIVNLGKKCTGYCNTGTGNSGNWNTGVSNSGDRNTGDCNSGEWNTGDFNRGYRNTGFNNSGDWNSGDHNSGNCNSGDWNKCNFSSGCFNTVEPKIYMFNKPSEWTYKDWRSSIACTIFSRMARNVAYISWENMSDEEKVSHPEAKTTGGYLKNIDSPEYAIDWWHELPIDEKMTITSLPNFDKKIFKEITGIDIDE